MSLPSCSSSGSSRDPGTKASGAGHGSGEISLNGEIQGVSGILPRVIRARENWGFALHYSTGEYSGGKTDPGYAGIWGETAERYDTRCLQAPEKYENESRREPETEERMEEGGADFADVCGQEGPDGLPR